MLKGKNAVITGANRGIGAATVRLFAENGANIWACARTESDEFKRELNNIAYQYGMEIHPAYFDVTDIKQAKKVMRDVGKQAKQIDILVNNAGMNIESYFNMTSLDGLRQIMETNFIAQFNLSQIISRYMIISKSGSIINVASVAGMENEPAGVAYGSSKAAVIFYTKTMAKELGQHGIRVNSVSPGFIDTDLWQNRPEESVERVLSQTPLGRKGRPEEVANAILFLASDMSSFITAQNIVVDGGRLG